MATRKAPARNLATRDTDPQRINLQKAQQVLERVQTLGEVKTIRDQAEAALIQAKNASWGFGLQNDAAELKLRAERKAGEFLIGLKLRGGDRKSNPNNARLKLGDLGINYDQSARWQKLAKVPEKIFEHCLRQMAEEGRKITASGLLRLAGFPGRKKRKRPAPKQRRPLMIRETDTLFHDVEAIGDEDTRKEALEELAQHHAVLANLLGAESSAREPALKPADWRAVRQILREMGKLIHQICEVS